MNVYENVEAKEAECVEIMEVLECGYDIIDKYREVNEELTDDEQVSLCESANISMH